MGYGFSSFLAIYGVYLFMFFGMNFGLSFIGAAIAKKKGFSYGGFLCLGIFVAFWLSLIIAASLIPRAGSRSLEQKSREQQYRQQYQHPPQNQPAQPNMNTAISFFACTGCGAKCNTNMSFCPSCGKKDPAV